MYMTGDMHVLPRPDAGYEWGAYIARLFVHLAWQGYLTIDIHH